MNEDQLRAELEAVYASSSWKITAPLRYIVLLLKRGGLSRLHKDVRALLRKLLVPTPVVVPQPIEIRPDRLSQDGKRMLSELQSRIHSNQHMKF